MVQAGAQERKDNHMKGYDKWLLPPDPPTHFPCDKCKSECDVDDLVEVEPDYWLCPGCLEDYEDDDSEQEEE